MTNVAIFTGSDLRNYGGGEKYVIEMSNRLIDSEFNVTLFPYKSERSVRISLKEVKVLTKADFEYYNAIEIPEILERIPFTISALKIFLNLKKFDVIYNYGESSVITNIMLCFFSSLYNKKYIFGIHDPNTLKDRPIEPSAIKNLLIIPYIQIRKLLLLWIKFIRVMNSEDRRKLIDMGYRGKIFVITDFVNTRVLKKDIVVNRKEFIVLFVGRLAIRHKGIDLLCDIINRVNSDGEKIKFVIIGKGDDGEELVKELSTSNNNVKWLNFVKEEELLKQFKRSSLIIFTSRFESFGLSLAEGQSYGLPAIAFDVKGPHDIIKKDFQGKLVKAYDTIEFSNQILLYYRLWLKNKITIGLKRKISKEIMDRYSDTVIIPKIERLFTPE